MATSAAVSKKVVSHNEWVAARTAFLKKEKEFSNSATNSANSAANFPGKKLRRIRIRRS